MTVFEQKQLRRKMLEGEALELLKADRNAQRFFKKIAYEPMSGCWLWTGATGKYGHGQFYLRGKKPAVFAATRASWLIHNGELSATALVCHKCDNPFCVNPDHLFLGSQTDNMRDCANKGRLKTPLTAGEHNAFARLSEADVRNIRSSKLSNKELALLLGVAVTTVHAARTGVTWRHLT